MNVDPYGYKQLEHCAGNTMCVPAIGFAMLVAALALEPIVKQQVKECDREEIGHLLDLQAGGKRFCIDTVTLCHIENHWVQSLESRVQSLELESRVQSVESITFQLNLMLKIGFNFSCEEKK